MPELITILDGYIDEPSCLGVPPYLAPLPRYIYGAIKDANPDFDINYMTVDEYRIGFRQPNIIIRDKLNRLQNSRLLVIIAGAIVPGKYLRGKPISFKETLEIAKSFDAVKFLGGACARFGFGTATDLGHTKKASEREKVIHDRQNNQQKKLNEHFDHVNTLDLDAAVFDYLTEGAKSTPQVRYRTMAECKTWSKLGIPLVIQHPNYLTSLIIELEAGRGCVRYYTGGCSFCSEPRFDKPEFRPPQDIIEEAEYLSFLEVVNFRIGALSDIFSYHARGIGKGETPKPNPKKVGELLKGIRSAAPNLKVLHLDNANPAVMAANLEPTKEILKTIVEHCTGGNVLSFGLESADPKVIKANNLNTHPDEVFEMVKLVNEYGSTRSKTGLPTLLPGINFVHGLPGESKETFKINFNFLKSILDEGLMLRRINLRQVLPISRSDSQIGVEFNTKKYHNKYHKDFIKYKKTIREQIDRPMLERLLPPGTIINKIFTEKYEGNITFGRQLGTYPILVGIPYEIPLNMYQNIMITDYGFRSVTGIAVPFPINNASLNALQALPGIGKKRAIRLLRGRPYRDIKKVNKVLDDSKLFVNIEEHLKF
jgi:radical SAM superfamily enzyme with C-terminal helix-hairpin-helix motif